MAEKRRLGTISIETGQKSGLMAWPRSVRINELASAAVLVGRMPVVWRKPPSLEYVALRSCLES